ncbi:hypothetical protein [Aliiroseovarius crassostreae]|uniref:hypothetical protein n=1 Tax=Aliiroseovarius crassostreae TaxID=154981 RepID=UPI0022054FDB|nr:hypothetical protein [Aliiroseovarius crassostreae]UWP97569.1 hypothetical protein K3X53_09170 [Aliiroseovarius crassostreae]
MTLKTFNLTLISSDKKEREVICVEVPLDAWRRMKEFHLEAENVRNTRFCQERMGGSINLNFTSDKSISSRSPKGIDEEALGHLLMQLRPVILQSEHTYFLSILKLCSRYCKHPMFRRHLSELKKIWELQRMQQLRFANVDGEIPDGPEDIFNWLNGYAYHRDSEKKLKSDEKLGIFGKDRNGAPVVVFCLVDLVAAVLQLGDFIETIEVSDNHAQLIEYPTEWKVKPR